MDLQEILDRKEQLEVLEHQEPQAETVPPEAPEPQGPRDFRDFKEMLELPVSPDLLVAPASQEPRAYQEIKVVPVHREHQDHRDLLARSDLAEIEGPLDLKELQGTEVQQGNRVLPDNRGHRVLRVMLVQLEQGVHKGHRVP